MTQERFKQVSFVAVILKKGNKVLLTKRLKEGWGYGEYALPGGGVDENETIRQAAVREIKEELDVVVNFQDLDVLHVMHVTGEHLYESIGFFLVTEKWKGEIKNAEPHRHEFIEWYDLDNMPKNITETLKLALEKTSKNEIYSEFGWK
ncbi:MAG: NUDIX domain-containing protein [bacterium]